MRNKEEFVYLDLPIERMTSGDLAKYIADLLVEEANTSEKKVFTGFASQYTLNCDPLVIVDALREKMEKEGGFTYKVFDETEIQPDGCAVEVPALPIEVSVKKNPFRKLFGR